MSDVIAAGFSHIKAEGRMGNEPVSAGAFTNIFRITAIFDGIYGLAFFLAPTILFSMSQDPGFPTHPGWVRWAGGTLIGLAVGIWIASSDPSKQRPFVIALAIGHGLNALSTHSSANPVRGCERQNKAPLRERREWQNCLVIFRLGMSQPRRRLGIPQGYLVPSG
jgi:hypothetical protein